MAAYPNAGANTVGERPLAVLVKFLVDLTQLGAGSDCCLPGDLVHGELLEVDHVDGHRSVVTPEALQS